MHLPAYMGVKNQADQIKLCSRSQHARQQKEKGACAIGAYSDARAKIAVYACQVEFIIQRKKYMRHHHISEEESEYRLHIGHVHSAYHARNRNESNPGYRGAYHAERDYIPGRFVLSLEERSI